MWPERVRYTHSAFRLRRRQRARASLGPRARRRDGGGVLLSSLLLAVNLAKEVKWRGSSIVANKKEVPYTLHPLIG